MGKKGAPRRSATRVALLVALTAASIYLVYRALAPAPVLDPRVRVVQTDGPVPIYRDPEGDALAGRIPPGSEVFVIGDIPANAAARLAVSVPGTGAVSVDGFIDRRAIVEEDIRLLKERVATWMEARKR